MSRPRKRNSAPIWVRFTGAAGGTMYSYDDGKGQMRPGDVAIVPEIVLGSHWEALLLSGNAEIIDEPEAQE